MKYNPNNHSNTPILALTKFINANFFSSYENYSIGAYHSIDYKKFMIGSVLGNKFTTWVGTVPILDKFKFVVDPDQDPRIDLLN